MSESKPRLISITDRFGIVLFDQERPVGMMRDELGLSQRQLQQQATRETYPRNVTPMPSNSVEVSIDRGWIFRLKTALQNWRSRNG